MHISEETKKAWKQASWPLRIAIVVVFVAALVLSYVW